MEYIKVLAIDSTNTELKRRLHQNLLAENTCLVAKHQQKGRGQRGMTWHVDSGMNLTFSILLKEIALQSNCNFKLNALVSVAIASVLNRKLKDTIFCVKWPNDILAGNQKVCGILIENILKGSQVQHSVIGIGLNVNQTAFKNLPKATSLKLLTGKLFDLDKLLKELTQAVEQQVYDGIEQPYEEVLANYESHLFRKGVPSTFLFKDGSQQTGIIIGVSLSGCLRVKLAEGIQDFKLKELQLIY